MIFVCEPNCKGLSHEKVNSGFLHALRLAWPDEPIRLYAHPSHWQSLQSILRLDGLHLDKIESRAIEFSVAPALGNLATYRKMLRGIFADAVREGVTRILFLSFSAPQLAIAKAQLRQPEFDSLRCAFVLHGEFESVADDRIVRHLAPAPVKSAASKARALKLSRVPASAWRFFASRFRVWFARQIEASLARRFPYRGTLLERPDRRVRYIALSPHIVPNARRYLDVDALGVRTVTMPISYAQLRPLAGNDMARFAVFGYGDSAMLHAILTRLTARLPAGARFEIRIIGMDDRGMEAFPFVTPASRGAPLEREKMEALAEDVDIFLSLYTEESYRLSCSGSIFEAISNVKPMLHFPNECIDEYDRPEHPIGIRALDQDDYVSRMLEIIGDYPGFLRRATEFRANLIALRERYSIAASAAMLRDALTWDGLPP